MSTIVQLNPVLLVKDEIITHFVNFVLHRPKLVGRQPHLVSLLSI